MARNSHVLVYHGPLLSHLLGVAPSCAIYFHCSAVVINMHVTYQKKSHAKQNVHIIVLACKLHTINESIKHPRNWETGRPLMFHEKWISARSAICLEFYSEIFSFFVYYSQSLFHIHNVGMLMFIALSPMKNLRINRSRILSHSGNKVASQTAIEPPYCQKSSALGLPLANISLYNKTFLKHT